MKFTVETNELQKALSKINGAIPSKSTLPILENVLVTLEANKLTLTATDLELSMSAILEVRGSEDGTITVPAKKVMDTLRAMPNQQLVFTADTNTNKIKMITENGEYNLIGEASKEYPSIPEFRGENSITVSNEVMKSMISKAIFAVSVDELRPAMTGLLFQFRESEIRSVATDGHRLVRIIYKDILEGGKSKLSKDVIIPSKALGLVLKVAEEEKTTIMLNSTHVRFDFKNLTLTSRLIEEAYPNYESVIPLDNDKKLQINREELLSAIKRVALYSSTNTHQIRMSLKKNEVKISAEDIDFGGEARERLTCVYGSEEMEVGFNALYLMDILSHLESDEVLFYFNSPVKAVVVTQAKTKEKEDVLMLVMPMRLNV